ncbi:MAG: acyl-CoA thioesterase [Clostridiales bacterium]|nr:acyl-CoA thioesterase [Clostridiales bacterium]
MLSKRVQDSFTTQIQILMPDHINGQSRMFGGRIMEWLDVVAAVVARRHSGCEVTTACVDSVAFLAPAYVNSTVIIEGRMTYVGNTSMEVRVDAFTESLSGVRKQITKAYFVLVALDEAEKPITVPRLICETEEEKAEFENGKKRAQIRAELRAMQ